jgi:hypothetical protein
MYLSVAAAAYILYTGCMHKDRDFIQKYRRVKKLTSLGGFSFSKSGSNNSAGYKSFNQFQCNFIYGNYMLLSLPHENPFIGRA